MSGEFDVEVAEQIARLRVLWPVLNSRPEHTQEIVSALHRHHLRVTASDIRTGFSDAIENAPTNGWPPGPHEVLGCVLKAAEVRKSIHAPRPVRHFGGLTFAQWWSTIPEDQRDRHAALHKLMTRENADTADAVEVAEFEEVVADVRSTHPPDGDDEIDWTEAA